MSVNKENIYTQEFRDSSVKLAMESKNTIAQTARDLGVKVNTLHSWIYKHSGSKASAVTKGDDTLQAELKKLKKEIAQVTIERDILKKAAAYFAKEAL